MLSSFYKTKKSRFLRDFFINFIKLYIYIILIYLLESPNSQSVKSGSPIISNSE